MLLNFWPFKRNKPKPTSYVAAIVGITHKSGEKINIVIEGQTPELVAFVANKIRSNFGILSKEEQDKINKEVDEMWEASDKMWDAFDRVHKKAFKRY